MSLALLFLVSFSGAFAMGYAKFYGLGYLCDAVYTSADKPWVIQVVGSLMTLGPVAAYGVSGPLASAFPKAAVMSTAAGAVLFLAGLGWMAGWPGGPWPYLFMVGLMMGVHSAAKMACVPLEAARSGRSPAAVNGALTIAFIVGILSGLFCGASAYENHRNAGLIAGLTAFALAALLPLPCRYGESRHPFRPAVRGLIFETLAIFLRHPLYLLSSPLIWGVAGALSLAVTAYAEGLGLGNPEACSLMSLFATLGIIPGNVLSTKLQARRYAMALSCALALALLIAALPSLAQGLLLALPARGVYVAVAGLMVAMGLLFGIATNLIDAEYLERVGREGREGSGAALQSALIAAFSFLLGGTIGLAIFKHWLDPTSQFLLLAALAGVAGAVVFILGLARGAFARPVMRFVAGLLKLALALRYRVRVRGLDKLDQRAGTLFLANHPAEVDPLILSAYLHADFAPRPVAVEDFYHHPLAHPLMKAARTIPIPDLTKGSGSFRRRRMQQALEAAAAGLRAGDNVLLYPAGQLMRSGLESLGAASGVQRLLAMAPEARIALVRTRGLWGSSFSTALTGGATPDLGASLRGGLRILIENMLMFAPRREVAIEISIAGPQFPRTGDAAHINRFLENFFNEGGGEAPKLVRARFWSAKFPELRLKADSRPRDLSAVDPALRAEVLALLARRLGLAPEALRPEAHFARELGLDSLAKAELAALLDEKYICGELEVADLETVADACLAAAGLLRRESAGTEEKTAQGWPDEPQRPGVLLPQGECVQACFLRTADRMGNCAAIADGISGVWSWRRLKTAALFIAHALRHKPGACVGVLLPASASACAVVCGVLLARKTPVMLNWTLGRVPLEHTAKTSGLEFVLSARGFLDRLDQVDLGDLESRLVFLEDLAQQAGVGARLDAWFSARKSAAVLLRELGLEGVQPQQPAVVLFTSGSESVPKGVPLSHGNVLANLRGAIEVMDFRPGDALLGILPPFHSFGFTLTTLLPLCAGLRAAYHPSPTQSRRIARASARWKASLLCGTPTFLTGILKAAAPGELASLRHFIAGAEKAPEALFESVRRLGTGAELLEGYGITECGPVLALNRPGAPSEGVGQPFPGVEILITDPASLAPLENGTRGLILARGPGVFSGYLGSPRDPFIEAAGQRWYNTGDLGYLTPAGRLVLAGRMKRFIKIAGEMVSLPALEEVLTLRLAHGATEGAGVAVEALEVPGKRTELWLFSTFAVELEAANTLLREAGMANIARLSRVRILDALPLLGSGKTDYRALKAIIEKETGVVA